jgi:pleiotropic regulator 1
LRVYPRLATDYLRNKLKMASKLAMEYADVQTLPPILQTQQAGPAGPKRAGPAGGGAQTSVKLIGGPETARYVSSVTH